jgi:D-serine deaminase-like pyridoxal phosphate-dependent protein
MVPLSDVDTPALLLDRQRLDQNLERMRTRAEELGVRLRPHMKTAKSAEVARRVVGHNGAITVSTLAEAEYFFDAGFTDILYAVGIAPTKLDRVAGLRSRGADLQVIVDSPAVAAAVAEHGEHRVWIEIDSDGRRAGVSPADDETLVEIAACLGERLVGVLTHCGGSYDSGDDLERLGFARMERDAALEAANVLRAARIRCDQVSVGSTPTITIADDLTGVTEVRPGVYMFMDLFQAGLGVCDVEDIAVSVKATVVGSRPDGVVIDAGALALSLDRSTASQPVDMGFGLVCDSAGVPIDDLIVQRVTQEHGVVMSRSEGTAHLPLGSTVRILPNHACMTAAAHESYHVVEGDNVVDRWDRCSGW